jgi:hypothetical protein
VRRSLEQIGHGYDPDWLPEEYRIRRTPSSACGFPLAGTVREEREVDTALPIIRTAPGPLLYVAKVRAEPLPFALPPRDGALLKDRFRHALLKDARPGS